MGNQQVRYSVPVGEKKEGESHIYRDPNFTKGLVDNFKGSRTLQELFIQNSQKFAKSKLLGTQQTTGQNSKHYVYKTYAQCFEIAQALGSGIINLKLIPEVHQYEGLTLKFVGVFAKNREEWLLLDYANILYGNTMIPLYDTLGPESIPFILNQSEINTIFCSAQGVGQLMAVADLGRLKTIVTFDTVKEELINQVTSKGLQLLNFSDVILEGQKNLQKFAEVKPSDIYTFSYTSGTTGNPKGVMLTHQNFVCTAQSPETRGVNLGPTDVLLSYLPLPHVFERIMVNALMGYGGTICFYGGDVMKIKDDLMLAKPTIFASVPRLFQRLYQTIKENLDKVQGYSKSMVDYALSTKLYHLKNGGHVTHRLWDRVVFNKTKEAFGGRVRVMITGSAPISGEIIDFMKIVACCPMVEGYGQTESTGGSFLTSPMDPISGHVGGPLNQTEFKLLDVVEMNYTSNDKDENENTIPRGEICFRGPSVFAGYYRELEKTKEALDDEGWLHSGDIGMILPNGALKIFDRRKNIFKLQQGEYIAPEKVENVYLKVKGVSEIFVYGCSLQAYCVAIVVPTKQEVHKVADSLNVQGSFEEQCANPDVIKHFLDALVKQGKADKLNGMENVKRIYLEPKSFVDYGCMTNTLKLQRHIAKNTFKGILDKLYVE